MKQLIKSQIVEIAGVSDFSLESPPAGQPGDLATNVAFVVAKKQQKSPTAIAGELAEKLSKVDLIGQAKVAGSGFINLVLKEKFLNEQAGQVIQLGDKFGHSNIAKDKKARVEFVSANPTGPLHIGNARGGPLGDVIGLVLEAVGYKVLKEYIDNDVGGQVRQLGETLIGQGKQYQGEYIKELRSKISKDSKISAEEAGNKAVEILFKEIIADCKAMGIEFDKVYKESDFASSGQTKAALDRIQSVLKQKDGATWFAPSDKFLKDRQTVVVKSDSSYTYFANDIAYHRLKFSQEHDLVVDVFGSNHHGHVPRLQAVVKALGFDVEKLKFVLYQFVRVKRGSQVVKMSKRAGTFVTAREVLDEVGKDAFRFFMLMHDPNTHMDFDLELAKKKSQENPVFYVQYAAVRAKSILRKAKLSINNYQLTIREPEERRLVLKLLELPDLVEELARTLRVHQLTQYAIETAKLFHDFYEKLPVIEKDLPAGRQGKVNQSRLALVKATLIVLDNTLQLLGVSSPEKM